LVTDTLTLQPPFGGSRREPSSHSTAWTSSTL
jgi:hypothetical protein